MDVFEAFPNAIIIDQWELVEVDKGTEVGTEIVSSKPCDVIVDEGSYASPNRTPDANYEESNILLYARATDMPTLATAALHNGYMWHDTLNDYYYDIEEASLGKNQETGVVEHIEFLLRQTEVVSDEF